MVMSFWQKSCSKSVSAPSSANNEPQRLPTLAELHNEKIFWKIYSSSVGGRSGHHESKMNNLHLQPALATAFSSSKVKEAQKDDRKFWSYFLNQATSYVIVIQLVNLIFLVFMAVVMCLSRNIVKTGSIESGYELILADLMVWATLSVVTIGALLIMRYSKDTLRAVVGEGSGTIFETWKKIGQFILLVRLLIVIVNLSLRATNKYGFCYIHGEGERYADNTFQVILILACLCSVETMVFSTLSFPVPWAIVFCLIELVGQQGFRFLTCSHVLFANGNYISFVSIGAFLAIVAMYSIVGLNTSVILLSSKNFYQNTQRLDSAAAEKRRFLDLLCTEIRSPLQHVVGTVCRITNTLLPIADSHRSTILEIEQRVERETQLINLLSDNLLYLTRVEEGRALSVSEQPNTLQRIVVSSLTKKLCRQHSVIEKDGLESRDLVSKVTIVDTEKKSSIYSDLSLMTILVRNILFFGIIMLNDLRNIESKGYRNHFKKRNVPPLIITITITERKKHDTDKKKSELSSRLHFSLQCPALSLNTNVKKKCSQSKDHGDSGSSSDKNSIDHDRNENSKKKSNEDSIYYNSNENSKKKSNEDSIYYNSNENSKKKSNEDSIYYSNDNSKKKSSENVNDGSNEEEKENENGNDGNNENESAYRNSYYLDLNDDNLSAMNNQGDYSTILMTCIALTSRAEGSFNITRDKVDFSISCGDKYNARSDQNKINNQNESEHRKNDNYEAGRVTNEPTLTSLSPGRGAGSENFSQKIDTIRVSVIAEGSELASAIPSLLGGIGILDCNITTLNDFDATNQDAMNELCRDTDVCFVSSTSESIRIKESGFTGRVVLFSGSVLYMDDETVKECDYIVNIPYMKADSDNLKSWLNSPIKLIVARETSEYKSVSRSTFNSDKVHSLRFQVNSWLRSIAIYFNLISLPKKCRRGQRRREKINDSSMILSSKAYSSAHSISSTIRQRHGPLPIYGVNLFKKYIERKVKKGFKNFHGFSNNDSENTYPLGTKFNFLKRKVLWMNKFQHDVEMTFCMWRLLNPTGFRVYHVFATDCANVITTVSFLLGVTFYTILFNPVATGICKDSYCYNSIWTVSVPLFCLVVKLRGEIYNYILVPLGCSLYVYWLAGSILIIIAFNIHLLDFYFRHHENSWIGSQNYWIYEFPSIKDGKFTLSEFCSTPFGATSGLEIVHVLLSSFGIICAGWTNHIVWPLSIVSSAMAIVRSFIIIVLINSYVSIDEVVQYVVFATYTLFAITTIVAQFYLEYSLRNEFQSFRKTAFSHMFLELSLDALHKNLKKPLTNILESKEKFLKIVLKIISSKRIEFSNSLLADFDTLNMGYLLLKELYFELDLKDNLVQATFYNSKPYSVNGNDFHESLYSLYHNDNEPFLLTEKLLDIASCFSCFRSDFTVKVYVDVHPSLTLIRTNAKIFTCVIINALSKAFKNIWLRLRSSDKLRNYLQEISVVVRPLKLLKSTSFFDTKLMNIEVSESSGYLLSKPKSSVPFWSKNENISEYPVDDNEGFGSRVCREVILFSSKESVYQSESSKSNDNFQYSYLQFTLPYQMHTCTGTAESLRKMKTPPGALFTARPTATYVDSYESFHERKYPINSDADNKKVGIRMSILIIESADLSFRNNGLKDLFSNAWHYQSISSFDEWDESCLQYDCVLIDLNSISIMQNTDGSQSNGNANDIDVVTLLRVLGYKMVIACIDKKGFSAMHPDKDQKHTPFDFCFTALNFSRIGIRQLEEKCNKFAISNLCWFDGIE